ncbi:O-antigen ligase family protein [Ruminococcus gauvreauii]|uniref:O-antigen ligase family protein n=1 Tax=Ruminococcus gauvreauii TaxID=438033 RepID=A0ABY5VFN9_9FIRM|nr:O-antigen ligase family protein [Ruminococcus gauvreauii]UWP59053.1 O-antigen ligase family protein [Ruminococcus gauvreauii]
MNHAWLTIKRRKANETLFLASIYLMIIMTVFNGNTYLAGLSFVWFPSFLLLGASLFMKKHLQGKLNLLVVFLGISAALSTYLSKIELNQSTFINLEFCILSYVIISSVVLSHDMFNAILKFYVNFGFLLCVILIFNYIFSVGIQVFNASNIRVTIQYFGIAKDVNYLSAFILPTFAYHLYVGLFARRRNLLMKAAIIFVAMFIAGSRACFMAMMLTMSIIFIKMVFDSEHKMNKPLIITALIIGGIVLYVIVSKSAIFARTMDFDNYTSNSRVTIWTYAMNGFFAKPVIGSGVESGSYYSLLDTRWKTHNCFIDILVGQGLIGAFIVLWIFLEHRKVNRGNGVFMAGFMICFFVPLIFVNGYECATFWMPMIICRYIYKKCRETNDILTLLYKQDKRGRKMYYEDRYSNDSSC